MAGPRSEQQEQKCHHRAFGVDMGKMKGLCTIEGSCCSSDC